MVEIAVADLRIRCICGYAPQESDPSEKKEKFWAKLSNEVMEANLSDACTIIQMDGNLWGGPELIKNDPNKANDNGRLFKTFLENHPHITVVNNLDICQGSITRTRKTVNSLEISILDFFIVCEKLNQILLKMIVDEEKLYALSNYFKQEEKLTAIIIL